MVEYSSKCEDGGECSKSHYSPGLKRIIVLANTNSVTTPHIQEEQTFARFPALSLPQNGSSRRPFFHSAIYPSFQEVGIVH